MQWSPHSSGHADAIASGTWLPHFCPGANPLFPGRSAGPPRQRSNGGARHRKTTPPPHFHALYGEHEAVVSIRTLEVMRGGLPRRALALVLEWAAEHRDDLLEDWALCERKQSPRKIAPLA